MSDRLQSTHHCHSSQTPPPDSGADTCPRPPTHEGRKEAWENHSGTNFQPEQPAISPEIWLLFNKLQTHRQEQWLPLNQKGRGGGAYPLCAYVHTLVHRHVQDDCTKGKRQCDIVRPMKTTLENCTAVWKRWNKMLFMTRKEEENDWVHTEWQLTTVSISLSSDHWPLMQSSHWCSSLLSLSLSQQWW